LHLKRKAYKYCLLHLQISGLMLLMQTQMGALEHTQTQAHMHTHAH